ncbi:Flp pilus assembly complex ATPase component TadA [Candidatus Micrarchaeota archaeon]|nr:Flp pilus assembly complex ATPase component TadA [Candidatus Micrarchaeota archaeon]
MCNLYLEGTRAIVDLAKCPYEFASPEFLNLHLKDLSTTESPIKTIRYEEEIVVELNEKKTSVLTQYAAFIRQLETILLKNDIYGLNQDPASPGRKKMLKRFYEYVFLNPILAANQLADYQEDEPERSIYFAGYRTFKGWVAGILKRYKSTALYDLVKETGDLRAAFLNLVGLRTLYFVPSLVLDIPPGAKPVKADDARYDLPFGVKVQIYEVPNAEAYLYVQENTIENLGSDLNNLLKTTINEQFKEQFSNVDWDILMSIKTREYRQFFIDRAMMEGNKITPQQAMEMGRECAAWVVGMGAHIENLALDKENITDIYIDSENSPIYIEHAKYGLCHTLYRYNRDLLERCFKNIVQTLKGTRKFDENSPIVDVVLKRHAMRCHLQRPPATFGELQGALRIMKEQPFTYAQYLNFKSFTPFFAGYDDVMVTLGCSEAVLGLKGVGKTSFTAAKVTSIGTRRRIIPIQDIEEIPVRAFRKRGFHIGAARVQSSESEGAGTTKELDLVTMANALLRMGDAALIINEVRSRIAVQGIINLLNTQPGVFLLYNLHAESLRDVQDRLELVFGLPAASMYATDRYSFLKKIRFGRKGRIYRVLGFEYETDIEEKKFVEIFRFRRGDSIKECTWEAKFLRNPEATMTDFENVDIRKLERELDIAFIPPALGRRSEETGISPEQYIIQAFWKGKMYDQIYKTSLKLNDKLMLELDFVLKVNTAATRHLVAMENEQGGIDFGDAWDKWEPIFKQIVQEELSKRKLGVVQIPDEPKMIKENNVSSAPASKALDDVEEEDNDDPPPAPPPSIRAATKPAHPPAAKSKPETKKETKNTEKTTAKAKLSLKERLKQKRKDNKK